MPRDVDLVDLHNLAGHGIGTAAFGPKRYAVPEQIAQAIQRAHAALAVKDPDRLIGDTAQGHNPLTLGLVQGDAVGIGGIDRVGRIYQPVNVIDGTFGNHDLAIQAFLA